MKELSTDELLKILNSTRSKENLDEYTAIISKQPAYSNFAEYLKAFLQSHEITDAALIKDSLIPRTYAYQILNGTKNPGRSKVLALCIAAKMNYDETQRALALANVGKLYPRRREDSIIIFALAQNLSVLQTNEVLYEECGITL